MRVEVFIKGDKLDLFKDETIEVKSSVADVEDITKNTTDFTKSFTVPASKGNNKLFKHWYNASIGNSFDARIKVDGEIYFDGMLFKKGKFRLYKVAMKGSKPTSYTVSFFGSLLSLKDKLGKDELSSLDLSSFSELTSSANTKLGLTTGGTDIIYNLLAKKQYYYNSDVLDTYMGDTLANIAYGDGIGVNGVLWDELRPSLKVIRLIEAIENKYNIVFSRHFFGRSEFTDLYTWLNNDKSIQGLGTKQQINWDGGNSEYINHTTNIGMLPTVGTASHDDGGYSSRISTRIIPAAGYETVDYKLILNVDNEEAFSVDSVGNKKYVYKLRRQDAPTNPYAYRVEWFVESNQEFKYTAVCDQDKYFADFIFDLKTTTASENTVVNEFNPSLNIPKIKIIDFLKGLFKMFKLVVIPQNDGSLYINTFKSYYEDGVTYDVSKNIEYNSHDVKRGKILNEINYVFSEPSTILNKTFEKNTRVAYGDSETILKDENGEVLDGSSLKFKLPFEQVLFERLTNQLDSELTNIQYGAIIDESLDPTAPKMQLFYNVNVPLNGTVIGFINDIGVKESISTNINTPSHTISFNNPNFSTLFDAEYSTWDSSLTTNTLYRNYHEEYILSIFNIKKRSFNFVSKNLPLRVMLDLRLNDLLKIRNNYYRINSFTTNLITGDVKFDLINYFGSVINEFSIHPNYFELTSEAQRVSSNVSGVDSSVTFSKVDVGSGVDWVTITQEDGNLIIDVDENLTTSERIMDIEGVRGFKEKVTIGVSQLSS